MCGDSTLEVHEDHVLPEGRILLLNSKWLMTAHVKVLAEELGLPTPAATDELHQLIEGKLMDKGRDPRNVQVIVQQQTEISPKREVCLFLVNDVGIFARREVSTRRQSNSESSSGEWSVSVSSGEGIKTLQKQLKSFEQMQQSAT